jgi:hypothetical protein
LQLDDQLKQLLRELGHAINDTVSDSERISGAIASVRAAGYDIVLKLDATIGLAKREAQPARITTHDRRFLESLRIQVDQDVLEEEQKPAKFEMTPHDIRFLKSLKIALDDAL